MERRFQTRLDELLDDAQVRPGLLRGVLPRLGTFLEPFARSLLSPEQRVHAQHYLQGLISDLQSKDVESIAYLHDQERQGLQKFIGQADWDHRPLFAELVQQVGQQQGWHHHQALSLLATWFLLGETRRGKNTDSRADGASGTGDDRRDARADVEGREPDAHHSHRQPPTQTQRGSTPLPLARSQPLTSLAL